MTVTVAMTVASHVHCSPATRMATMLETDEKALLTKLLPMRMAESVLSKRSATFRAICARREPSSAAFSMRRRLSEEKAISEAEKNADRHRQTIQAIQ